MAVETCQDTFVKDDGFTKVGEWLAERFGADSPDLPFCFNYGGQPSAAFLKRCKRETKVKALDAQRTGHTVIFTDPGTGLEVRCAAIQYHDFPTVEWTVYFKNNGGSDSPVLDDIQSLDISFTRQGKEEFSLYHNRGDGHKAASYQPLSDILYPGEKLCFAPSGGRPTNMQFPFYNLAYDNGGVIIVIGWPGQWAAGFSRDQQQTLHIRGGQELTHLKLHPGEEIRTPLVVLQFWQGDRTQAQNVWRRWMIAHNMPKPEGGMIEPLSAGFDGYYFSGLKIDKDSEKHFIDRYVEEQLTPDYWWIDAGWYPCEEDWRTTGTWEADRDRFPNGLREVTDYARDKGIAKSVVWFEPERVAPGTWLYENHPEWLLEDKKSTFASQNRFLLNLGNPEAWDYLVGHVSRMIDQEAIDLYRQDFNMNSLDAWRANDSELRQGMTEIKYVTGYLAFWDELRRRKPNLIIDSCAAGGRRNDLETLRRSLPLWRSDYSWKPAGMQCHTYALSSWIPYYGTGVVADDTYTFRSDMAPGFIMSWDMRKDDLDYERLRCLMRQWRQVAHYYLGDFYPLTPYSLDDRALMAWQFDRQDLSGGMLQAFRRAESPFETANFKLKGLNPDADYTLRDFNTLAAWRMTGRRIMDTGIRVALPTQESSNIITYKLDIS